MSLLTLLPRNSTGGGDVQPDGESQYGYFPSERIAILFVTLYGISTIAHIGQAIWFRMWWLLPTVALCGVGEILGWSGRLWSAMPPAANMPFMIQISTTIIAPTPLLAAIFVIFSRIVQELGTSYSLSPNWYTAIFVPCDIIALVVQGVGGGIASAATTLPGANRGGNIMLGGIAFQFVIIVLFSMLALDFTRRYLSNTPARPTSPAVGGARGILTPRLQLMLGALALSTTTLFIRGIYRIIELAGGWTGRIIHTQVYFNVLDGGMVVLAIYTLNFMHPGILLRPAETQTSGTTEGKTKRVEMVSQETMA